MTITTLPTRTSNSIGATKTDRRPPTGASYEWKAAEVNETLDRIVELYDEVGLSDGSTAGSLNERVADLESGSGSTLASWNGTDLTQFDSAITANFTSPTLTVVTTGSSKSIRFAATAATAGAYYLRWFTTPVTMRSMRWRVFVNPTAGAGDDIRAGVAVAGVNGTVGVSLYAITHVMGLDSGGLGTVDIGYAQGAAAPNGGNLYAGGGFGDLHGDMTWTQVAATSPAFILRTSTLAPADSPEFTAALDVPGLGVPALDASWASQSPNRVGIYFTSTGGAAGSISADLFEVIFEAR